MMLVYVMFILCWCMLCIYDVGVCYAHVMLVYVMFILCLCMLCLYDVCAYVH